MQLLSMQATVMWIFLKCNFRRLILSDMISRGQFEFYNYAVFSLMCSHLGDTTIFRIIYIIFFMWTWIVNEVLISFHSAFFSAFNFKMWFFYKLKELLCSVISLFVFQEKLWHINVFDTIFTNHSQRGLVSHKVNI